MNKKQLIIMGLVLALSLPLNVWAATTLGDDLTVGDGTPDVTQDGEDAYIEGTLEVDGAARFDGAVSVYDQAVSIISTADGATGASLALQHDSATPAALDTMGAIYFTGDDDGGNSELFGSISVVASDVGDGSEQGVFVFRLANGDGSGSNVGGFFAAGGDSESILYLGDPTGVAGATTGVITGDEDADIKIDPDGDGVIRMQGSGTAFEEDIIASNESSGITRGVKQTLIIDGDVVKPLLDGAENTLHVFEQNVAITDVLFVNTSVSGSAATVDVGTNANFTSGDVDNYFIDAVDVNDNDSQKTSVDNPPGVYGGIVSGVSGDLTIQSSADVSGSAWDGVIFVEYLYTNGL